MSEPVAIRWQGPEATCIPIHPAKLILADVARRHDLSVEAITGPSRKAPFVRARHEAAWMMRERGWSYPEIARRVGLGDHTSAINAVSRHSERLAQAQGTAA